jgi:hypothetical protein
MNTTVVDFTGDRPRLDLNRSLSGFKSSAQRCLINLGTRQGTDPLYEDRGTNLLRDAVSGRMVDANAAQHSANFAAADTYFFERTFDTPGDPDALAGVTLTTIEYDGQKVNFQAVFVSAGGEQIGASPTI